MAFQGYLIKINNVTFPLKYMSVDTYNTIPNQMQDLDSYRDANGVLHRNVLPHKASKIEFNTPHLYLSDKIALQEFFTDRKNVTVEYWNDESNTYQSGKFYVPDITYEIYQVTSNNILYKPIRIAFIEY